MPTHQFHWVNWVIVLGYLAAIAGVGFWFMHRNRSADDYFKGGGDLPWWAVSLSLYAAMFSSLTFLSIPALVYASDMTYLPIVLGAFPAVVIASRWYLPFFRELNLTSAYEYLERRFNPACRFFASGAFILFMIASIAVVTYLPAVALAAVTGMNVNIAIVLVIAVTILYSALGGLEAVVWSDFVQALLLLGTMVLIMSFLLLGTEGGFMGFVKIGMADGKFRVFDFSASWSKACFWVVFLGGFIANFAQYTSDQRCVQRYMAVKDVAAARKSMWTEVVLAASTSLFCFLIGVGLWTCYHSSPDTSAPVLAKNDQILPVYIAQMLPNGVSGVVFAAVAAATVSTLAANLNSAASAFTIDFYTRLFKGRNPLVCGRVCTVVAGIFGGGFALVLANMDVFSIYEQFQRFLGMLAAGLGSLFLMGLFMPRVNGFGAICGLAANYAVTFGLDLMPWPGKPHLLLYGLFGMVACVVVALVASRCRVLPGTVPER